MAVRGLALRLGRGESREIAIECSATVRPSQVRICEIVGPMDVRLKVDHNKLRILIRVGDSSRLNPLMLLKLTCGDDVYYIGVLPLGPRARRATIRRALKDLPEFSVGAPGVLAFQGGLFLSYRWRNGDKARGELLEIAVDSGDLLFRNVIKRFKKTDYGYWSFEKSSFATNGEEIAFLYCADTGETWKIFKCVSQSPLEIDLPGKVLISNAKDPAILYDNSKKSYVIVYSNLRKLGHDLVVATSRDLKQLTTLSEGLAWNQFAAQGNRWAKTHIHAGHISKIGKYYVLLYDLSLIHI